MIPRASAYSPHNARLSLKCSQSTFLKVSSAQSQLHDVNLFKFLRKKTLVMGKRKCTDVIVRFLQVSFVDNSQLVTVHPIVAWDYAYRAARVSEWMALARDGLRFQRRIQSLEAILSPVLSPEHRAKIWESRMSTE